ncbi:ABC transporter permease subunit [Shewanella sp. VB17]|uniref:ABC transporter permease subunit n=1 Tax=Shewanella sp. VB17 TaxID=2739432 RepID=UPI001567A9AF|nr:ABC transporter permease subunit [Shewanella sp. VB17]NRD75063.1 ABC transporter permease subunit [Shewanella sp. VB17]
MKKRFISVLPTGQFWTMAVPYFWLLLFFALPFTVILKLSLSTAMLSIPPYESLFSYADDSLQLLLNLGNYWLIFDDPLYMHAYLGSLKMASITTLACLIIGYPMAYAIARAPKDKQILLILLVMLPSWTSFLIRVYAWMGILSNNGVVNNFLLWLGVISEPIQMLNTNFAVYIGIIYTYLPFMVLPLYATLSQLDVSLLEAASDLGSRSFNTFWKITLPLSTGGIIAGAMLVFIPVVGEFVIPEMLGGPDSLMIGKVLWQEFFNNRDWPVASALAMVMLVLLIIPITLFHRYQWKSMDQGT